MRHRLLVLCVVSALVLPAAAQDLTTFVEADDGVLLATDIYLPDGAGPWPVILIRTPYERNNYYQDCEFWVAAEYAKLLGALVDMRPVTNTTLGETITVAGLLTGRDLITGLEGAWLGATIVLPAVMFRGPGGVTLDGMTPEEIGRALGRSVRLASGMDELDLPN